MRNHKENGDRGGLPGWVLMMRPLALSEERGIVLIQSDFLLTVLIFQLRSYGRKVLETPEEQAVGDGWKWPEKVGQLPDHASLPSLRRSWERAGGGPWSSTGKGFVEQTAKHPLGR